MVYHTCPDCDEENYFSCYDSKPEPSTTYIDKKYDELVSRMRDKIISLQNEIVLHFAGNPSNKRTLSDSDVLRYSAMTDILKSMLGIA